MKEKIMKSGCPRCRGKSGISCREWVEFERYMNWDAKDSEAEPTITPVKRGRWTCLDCGHRFNTCPAIEDKKEKL